MNTGLAVEGDKDDASGSEMLHGDSPPEAHAIMMSQFAEHVDAATGL